MNLEINSADEKDHRVLRLSGSLDLASRGRLVDAANSELGAGRKDLVLDLAGIEFIDSSGIGAIVEVARAAEDADAEFALRAPSARVQRTLEIAGLTDVWTVLDA